MSIIHENFDCQKVVDYTKLFSEAIMDTLYDGNGVLKKELKGMENELAVALIDTAPHFVFEKLFTDIGVTSMEFHDFAKRASNDFLNHAKSIKFKATEPK